MRKTHLLIGLLVLTWLVGVARAADQPNVLFLICDDLNCDVGLHQHPQVKTPNMDALAERGVRFQNAHCQFPLCGPSRISFMTGMYPDQTLVHRNAVYLREHTPNVLTIPQVFRSAGYFATRVGKIYHYNVPRHIGTSGHDDPYSWNQVFNPRGRDKDDEDLIFTLRKGTFGGTLSWLAAEGTDAEQTDGIAASIAVEQLKKHARQKTPFFMAVGLYRPHTPYVAPKKYFTMYPTTKIKVPTVPEGYFETIPKPAKTTLTRKKEQLNLTEDLARQAIQAYYASITFADAQLGIVLQALKDTGLEENTIVVFTSDHGYHMGEHGHYQKTTLFENATHVPLVIAGPGVTQRGKVALGPVEMVDIYPTLTTLAGLKTPAAVSGKSLTPMLTDVSQNVRASAITQYGQGYSIRTTRYRYTEWGPQGSLGAELYDHQSDPEEMHNLAKEQSQSATLSELSDLLHVRIAEANEVPQGIRQIEFDIRRNVPQPNP